jgi:hypothetical protein
LQGEGSETFLRSLLGEDQIEDLREEVLQSPLSSAPRPVRRSVALGVDRAALRRRVWLDAVPHAFTDHLDVAEGLEVAVGDTLLTQALRVASDELEHPVSAGGPAALLVPDDRDIVALVLDHAPEVTLLTEARQRIETCLDSAVLEVGRILSETRAAVNSREWVAWVEADLPFTLGKAEQLIAVHEAFARLPEDLLAQLPRPHQALLALRPLTERELADAVERWELGPDSTVVECREIARHYRGRTRQRRPNAANIRAAKLMEQDPDDLDPVVSAALRRWLSRAG